MLFLSSLKIQTKDPQTVKVFHRVAKSLICSAGEEQLDANFSGKTERSVNAEWFSFPRILPFFPFLLLYPVRSTVSFGDSYKAKIHHNPQVFF